MGVRVRGESTLRLWLEAMIYVWLTAIFGSVTV
jgi:hypothetical protein